MNALNVVLNDLKINNKMRCDASSPCYLLREFYVNTKGILKNVSKFTGKNKVADLRHAI